MGNADLAAQWVKGLSGDWTILEALSSPSMKIWHSHDNQWLTREEGAGRMAESRSTSSVPSFEDVRTIVTETGFVVQGSVEGLGAGRTYIVQICTVDAGRIASCEEYIAPEMTLG
jgi:hypothetical protein